ncbi:MAG: TIGR00725 family protein [Gammaproteobacteria bacterium]
MGRRPQITVIGSNADHCTPQAYELAYRVGQEVARQGAILLTGGLGGVMEAASKGAAESGGLAISVIPQDDPASANPHSSVVIATGIGFARDFITAWSADAVIIVGGGIGTLIEAAAAYQKAKPLFAVMGSGGTADEWANRFLDHRHLVRIEGHADPHIAVAHALERIAQASARAPRK